MTALLRVLMYVVLGLPLFVMFLLACARVVRHFYKFPMPEFMANVVDHPVRRRLQPPDETAARHGIEPGMKVLEIGPGNGTYTLAAARRVGEKGKVVAIDVEPRMVARVRRRVEREGVTNVETRIADACNLPFEDGTFDAIYMIAVIGEIPDPGKALRECHRVLTPSGTLAFSELLPDPDYPRSQTLMRRAEAAGFRLRRKTGNVLCYSLVFEKAR